MNLDKLKEAESAFLHKYPGGFDNPDMQIIGKKHRMSKRITQAQAFFAKNKFRDPEEICSNMTKVVNASSMISLFEKPKFRDLLKILNEKQKKQLSNGLKNFLHGNQEKGFNNMLEILRSGKLAKWSLMTIIPNYYHPTHEVFVKPTTTKGVIATFELERLIYKPQPSWEFYHRYRETILEMKDLIDSSLTPSNAAFSGFLMMVMNS
ncbi:hypothetical protein N8303_05355 [Gammaproteobacteria bacterium]|nr:hypothetical protein [Gammaproteobacteria bacterium]